MTAMESAISVRRLTKTYAQGEAAMRALDEVDLDVHAGELILLVGPSGSGKTTLLSIMGCILRATSGSVQVVGRETVGLPEAALPRIRLDHIGFVFQGFNLFGTLTALQNVALALDLKGVRGAPARKRALDLLEQVGMAAKAATYPADLSGGQKQRVAIARALACDPGIVLADEPTAALDSRNGHAVMALMRQLAHERDRAVVIVSHDSRMLGYADRIVRIEDGRIRHESRGRLESDAGARRESDAGAERESDGAEKESDARPVRMDGRLELEGVLS
jgi:putative ABC transport system ATP-binding protein